MKFLDIYYTFFSEICIEKVITKEYGFDHLVILLKRRILAKCVNLSSAIVSEICNLFYTISLMYPGFNTESDDQREIEKKINVYCDQFQMKYDKNKELTRTNNSNCISFRTQNDCNFF